ncbi:hypothetical protein GCM10009648_05780 [Tsukamurella spumae]
MVFVLGIWLIRFLWKQWYPGQWVATLSYVALDLLLVGYLFVAGRGTTGKLLGGGLAVLAMLIDLVVEVVFTATSGWPSWFDYLGYASGVLTTVLVVAAWGCARRIGVLWTISIPISAIMWAVWTFGIIKLPMFEFSAGDDSFARLYVWSPLRVLIVWAIPILIGWGLELLTRTAPSAAPPGPGAPRTPRPVTPAPPQPQQGHWQWHPGPPQAPQQPPSYPPRRD